MDKTKPIDTFREYGKERKKDGVGINTYVIRTGKVVKEHTELCRGNMIEKEQVKDESDDDRGILKWEECLVGGDRNWKSMTIINGVFRN